MEVDLAMKPQFSMYPELVFLFMSGLMVAQGYLGIVVRDPAAE
jgi:hypothetical protein